ncbi:MAG: ABC transporter ATP-binding protein [Limnochordaceae bacterium]|nr:ABC transporter ATP-binding protein [Limnochordaceae bacterium]
MHEFATLKEFFLRNKWRYIGGILALLAVDTLQLVMPQLLKAAANELQRGTLTHALLLHYVGLLVLVAIGIAAGRFGWRILINGAARQLERELRDRFFAHLEKLSANFFNQRTVGDLMAHATNDIGAVRVAAGPGIVMSVDSIFLSVSGLATMVYTIDLKLTGLALLPMPLLVVAIVYFGREINRRFRRVQESFADLTSTAEENLNGVRVVKAFVQEEAEMAKFSQRNQEYIARNMYLVRIWGLFDPLMQWLSGISLVIVIGYGGYLTLNGSISLGDFVAFNSYLGLITGPIMGFGWVVNNVQRGVASMARINAILREVPEIQDAPAGELRPDVKLQGAIEFRHLTFRYRPDLPDVLKDIDLRIEPGETVGILGRTGSGKSTLVNLLLRVYDPPAGTVWIDGVDVRHIPLATLREEIGYVPQENFLFSATVAENIAFAKDEVHQEEVEQAAQVAAIAEDVEEFPAGYQTMVGERGITLSGGQKQRVAIARAILKNPRILVLDDCLSAVDTRTEEQILGRLVEVMHQRTSILISHRISTLRRADRIVVLDQGRLVECGTHAQLLQRHGLYWETYQRQLLEEKLAEEA